MSKIFLIFIIFFSSTLWAGIGNIMAFKGHVDILRDTKKISAKMGMEINQKDKVLTQKSSRVQIMLKDKTVITVGSNSEFSFDEYFFDGTKNSKIKMSATKGFFRSLTGKIGKVAKKNFKLKTKSATIGIRGTDFFGDIGVNKETIACISGAISVEVNEAKFEVDAGSLIVVEPKKVEIKKIEVKKVVKTVNSNKKAKKTVKEKIKELANTIKQKAIEQTQEESTDLETIATPTTAVDSAVVEDNSDIIQQEVVSDEDNYYEEPQTSNNGDYLDEPAIQTQDREIEY